MVPASIYKLQNNVYIGFNQKLFSFILKNIRSQRSNFDMNGVGKCIVPKPLFRVFRFLILLFPFLSSPLLLLLFILFLLLLLPTSCPTGPFDFYGLLLIPSLWWRSPAQPGRLTSMAAYSFPPYGGGLLPDPAV